MGTIITANAPQRLLLLLTADCDAELVARQIETHGHDHSHVRVVAPLVGSRLSHFFSADEHASRPAAESRLADAVDALQRHGLEASGHVGDAIPLQALDDEVAVFRPHELVLVTHRADERQWYEKHLPEEATARFHLPLTVVEAVSAPGPEAA
ncbi:MAG: hypothetical protein ACR2JV_02775 [Gaiellales bacterium]